jgi:general secretion pathway protein G
LHHAICFALLAMMCATCGCGGRESRAERQYERAQEHVEAGEIEQAVEAFAEIIDRYPDTAAAGRARDELVLYRGLDHAIRQYPHDTARELMVQTARAIQTHRARNGVWPSSLDRMRPRLKTGSPIDPWGRVLVYEPKPRGRGYVLACLGSDGKPGGIGEARDLYVEDGRFVSAPSIGVPR